MATKGNLRRATRRDDFGPNALAQAHGWVAWTYDPMFATSALAQNNTRAGGVLLTEGDVIQGIAVPVSAGGVSVTFAGAAIYDANLNLVASGSNNGASFQSTGWSQVDLSTPYTVPSTGLYFIAIGFNASTFPSLLTFIQNATTGNPPAGIMGRGASGAAPSGSAMPATLSNAGFANLPVLGAY